MSDRKGGNKAPADTSALYLELSKFEKTQDFDKALKICNKILNVAPHDETAFHCKMVCFMQIGKYEDALKQIKDNHTFAGLDLRFEHAYCLYRLNKLLESLEVLDQIDSKVKSDKVKELTAQIHYRLEKYEESYAVYRDLLKNSSDDYEQERLNNLQAAAVFVENAPVADESQDESYELCYNRGCQLLSRKKWPEAEKALKKAEKMCADMMKEEEADDDEIERETGIIRVQTAFAIQMQGAARDREAQSIYNSVLKSKPSDIALVAVASNNMVAMNKDQNIFDSKKKMKASMVEGLEHKLTTVHQAAIARNNALLAMYTNQVDLCKNLVKELENQYGKYYDEEEREMILAGVLSRSGKVQDAVEILLKNKSQDLERILMSAQVFLEKGDVPGSINILEKLPPSLKYRTGLLSTMVSLYLAADERAKAAKLLKEAVSTSQKLTKSEDMKLVWRKTAEFHLKGDEPSVAAKSLEELLKANPNDKTTLAQLVLAYAKFDMKKALETCKKLPDFATRDVDVDALEATATMSRFGKKGGGSANPVSPKKPQTPEQQQEAEELAKKKRKKKRKIRLPKNYDSKYDPDPERWLPKKERTGYRRTRKERRKGGEKFTGAQGGTGTGQAEALDYGKKSAANQGAVPKSPQPQELPPGPRQAHRKPQTKGKKKGGKNRF